jgi:hypothetical protein
MAEYRAKGLFEAMQASKGAAQRPATPVVLKPPPVAEASTGPRAADRLGDAGSWLVRVVTGRLAVMAAIVVVVAFGLIWGGKALLSGHEGLATERDKPSAATVAVRPVDNRPAEQAVPAVSEPPAAVVVPPENRLGGFPLRSDDVPAIGSAAGGPFRIQVFAAPAGNRDEMEKERKKLAAAGFETVAEHRGSWYYVYTAETFATADGEDTVGALKKLRALSYGSAFATRKHTANR